MAINTTLFKERLTRSICIGAALFVSPVAFTEELRFVGSESFRPYYHLKDGVASGPLPEIVNLVCKEERLKCSITLLPWRRALKSIERDENNAFILVGKTPAREQDFIFSSPIITTSYGFFFRQSDEFSYHSARSLSGKSVSVTGPSKMSKTLEAMNQTLLDEGQPGFSITQRLTTDGV